MQALTHTRFLVNTEAPWAWGAVGRSLPLALVGARRHWAWRRCGVEALGAEALWGAWALCGACGRVCACRRGSEVHAARSVFQVLVGLKELLTEGLMTPRAEAAVHWGERGSESDTLALGTSRIPLVWAACV